MYGAIIVYNIQFAYPVKVSEVRVEEESPTTDLHLQSLQYLLHLPLVLLTLQNVQPLHMCTHT